MELNNKIDKIDKPEEKETIWNRVKIFYNKNKNELIVVLCLLTVYNFMCSSSNQYLNNQSGGDATESLLKEAGKGKGGLAKSLKNANVLQTMLGWMLSFVQSLLTFAGLVLVLAVLPGLPIFIFMLVLFFILRARVAAIKAY
jgi:hypothetical protein